MRNESDYIPLVSKLEKIHGYLYYKFCGYLFLFSIFSWRETFVSVASILVRPGLVPKNFHPKLSHRILWYMHGVLNIDEKKLIAQFGWKNRETNVLRLISP